MKSRCLCLFFAACLAGSAPAFAQWGRGGFGMGERRQILKTFDKDGDGYLNAAERKAARESAAGQMRGWGGRGRFGMGGAQQPAQPGAKVSPADVPSYPDEPIFTRKALRTFFLTFEEQDWEAELDDFYHTDVEVPATLTVDGKTYGDVGVHFRGNTSYQVGQGRKKSLGLSMDLVHDGQRLLGVRTLNLMNSASDPTFMRIALYQEIARQYIAAPDANWVRVVINGEDWGVYVNEEQFNSDFTKKWFNSGKGARWKLPVSMGGGSGLYYLGDDPARYKGLYEIKTKDDPKSWADLVQLCKILSKTAPDQLEAAIEPLLDIDGALKFLALDTAMINNDGYWVRASDFDLYEEPNGRFHLIPGDVNETFAEAEGGRGGWGAGVKLDPFAGAQDPYKALYRLLSVPGLRQRYLGYLRDIAGKWLDWSKMGPKIEQYQALIADAVKADTRKLDTTENFTSGVTAEPRAEAASPAGFGGFGRRFGGRGMGGPGISLKAFFEQRRAYLLSYPDTVKPAEVKEAK